MRTLLAALALGLLAWGCDGGSAAPLSGAHATAMEDSVASFLSTWSEGVRDGDWDRMARRYADDPAFAWVEDGQVRYDSYEALRSALEGLEAGFSGARTEFLDPEITPLAPGLANVAAGFTTTLLRSGEAAVRYRGAMTMTLVHTDDGWKVLQGHTSTERPRGDDASAG